MFVFYSWCFFLQVCSEISHYRKHEALAKLSDEERDYTYEFDIPDDVSEPEQEQYIVCAYAEGKHI